MFSMYDVSYFDRTLLTQHITPIILLKKKHAYINNASEQSLLVHFDNFTDNYTSKTLEHMHYP